MAARVVLDGLDDLKAALRALPPELALEAGPIVVAAAEGAKSDMRYPRITGDLADHLRVDVVSAGRYGAAAKLTQGSKLGYIFENGTQARHYTTSAGNTHVTGRMPVGNVFIPAVMRRRRAMYERLKALVASKGLTVTGDAG